MRKKLYMSKSKKPERSNTPIGIKIFSVNLLALILVGWLDRIFYIKFLNQNGYGLKDIFVPWRMIIEYHSSGIGLIFAMVILVLIFVAGFTLWGLNFKTNKDLNA